MSASALVPDAGPAPQGPLDPVVTAARLWASGAHNLLARRARPDAFAWILIAVWGIAVPTDAVTTLLMMSSGRFEEANAAAAAGMAVIGVTGYVIVVSAYCAVLAFLGCPPARSIIGWTLRITVLLLGVYKLAIGVSNIVLAFTGVDLPLL